MSASLDEVEVLERNRAFYTAFRRRDMATMESLWARSAKVACIHPGWQPIRGRGEVMASLSAILGQAQVPQIRCEDVSVHVIGDAAFVVCEEVLREGRLVATNVFVREEGDWRLLHHQAGPMAPDAEAEADGLSDDLSDDLPDDLSDDLSDLESGEDELDVGAFRSGPLAMGRKAPKPVELASIEAELCARETAAALGDLSVDGDEREIELEDDEAALGPGPLFHSPSDEPLSDPGASAEGGEDEGELDGARPLPSLETRPVADIADFGGSFRRGSRAARRLVN